MWLSQKKFQHDRGIRKELVTPRQSSFISYLQSHHYCTTVTYHKFKGPKKTMAMCFHREELSKVLWVTLNSPCLYYTGGRLLLRQMYSNCYQSQQNSSKYQRLKQAQETFEDTDGTEGEFDYALQASSGICLQDRRSKYASSSRLLSQAQVRGTKGDAVLPGPRSSNKVLSLDLLKWKHLKSGRESMFFQDWGLPWTTRNPLMQWKVSWGSKDLWMSIKRKGAFYFCLWEKKNWKDHLKDSFTWLRQVNSEILLNSSKQKTAVVIR